MTPYTQPAQAGQVDVGAGEGHRRVHRDGAGAHGDGRGEHGQAVAAAGVHDDLALADRAGGAEHRGDVVEHVVGDRQQQHVAGAGDGGRLEDGYAGQQGRGAAAGGVGLAGDGDDLVARRAKAGGQDGADTAGADHAHPEGVASCFLEPLVSVPPPTSDEGRSGTRRCALGVQPEVTGGSSARLLDPSVTYHWRRSPLAPSRAR